MADRVVRQNGERLVKISEELTTQAGELKALYDQFFDEIDKNLSDSNDQVIWFGQRASGCKNHANQSKPTFEEMKKAVEELAITINEHANSWGTMDSSGY